MNASTMAIDILRATGDGADLAPADLSAVESAVNNGLTEAGEVFFGDLHRRCATGRYRKPRLHGVEHLTCNHNGFVYWRDVLVEHYSYNANGAHKGLDQVSRRLGAACLRIEARGETVRSSGQVSKEQESEATP